MLASCCNASTMTTKTSVQQGQLCQCNAGKDASVMREHQRNASKDTSKMAANMLVQQWQQRQCNNGIDLAVAITSVQAHMGGHARDWSAH
jgi:hypothetical protein